MPVREHLICTFPRLLKQHFIHNNFSRDFPVERDLRKAENQLATRRPPLNYWNASWSSTKSLRWSPDRSVLLVSLDCFRKLDKAKGPSPGYLLHLGHFTGSGEFHWREMCYSLLPTFCFLILTTSEVLFRSDRCLLMGSPHFQWSVASCLSPTPTFLMVSRRQSKSVMTEHLDKGRNVFQVVVDNCFEKPPPWTKEDRHVSGRVSVHTPQAWRSTAGCLRPWTENPPGFSRSTGILKTEETTSNFIASYISKQLCIIQQQDI